MSLRPLRSTQIHFEIKFWKISLLQSSKIFAQSRWVWSTACVRRTSFTLAQFRVSWNSLVEFDEISKLKRKHFRKDEFVELHLQIPQWTAPYWWLYLTISRRYNNDKRWQFNQKVWLRMHHRPKPLESIHLKTFESKVPHWATQSATQKWMNDFSKRSSLHLPQLIKCSDESFWWVALISRSRWLRRNCQCRLLSNTMRHILFNTTVRNSVRDQVNKWFEKIEKWEDASESGAKTEATALAKLPAAHQTESARL